VDSDDFYDRWDIERAEQPEIWFADLFDIHYPLMSSVLAELRADDRRHREGANSSWFAVGVSMLALAVSIAGLFVK